MINTEDQEALFWLIADYLEQDLMCSAIGGTAMMFFGYKNATKDIDLVFRTKDDRAVFIQAIEKLGYAQQSLRFVYDNRRVRAPNAPLLYSRGEERFDLFVKDVFGCSIDFTSMVQRHDFLGKKELIVSVLPKEMLILLKALTNREKDYEDIESMVKAEPGIDWSMIVNEAIRRRKKMMWVLVDLEETMQKLKKITFIKKKYFDVLYAAEHGARAKR
jgi:hypothetical protein